MTGQTVGHYQITSQLGAGGMGEVYRARDTKLGRDVAIKVLPRSFAAEQDRLGRFEQEARTLASLNHPGIMVIHDSGIHDGAPYLISELLEGQTLRDLLKDGPLPARKAAEYAVQIARALAAAHNKGIIHRDLKPENLFITQDERVKVLDFGLAKLRTLAAQSEIPASARPTIINATEPGMVLGTPGYMSPEQARGGEAEIRSDIFSLGAVLYEMLCGQRAFEGESSVQVMNAILTAEPPELFERVERLPPALERVTRRCLEKRPEQRFQTAADLAFALENSISSGGSSATRQALVQPRQIRLGRLLPWLAALVGMTAGIWGLWFAWHGSKSASISAQPAPVLRKIGLFLPASTRVVGSSQNGIISLAIAPDGRKFVYTNGDGLWLQSLDHVSAPILLAGPKLDGAGGRSLYQPFWSPRSDEIAYFDAIQLRRISVAGGEPRQIASLQRAAGTAAGGAWLDDGRIIYSTGWSGLLQTTVNSATPATALQPDQHEQDFHNPIALPGGRGILFVVHRDVGFDTIALWTGSGPKQVLLQMPGVSVAYPTYAAPGYVLFELYGHGGGVMAFPFSLETLKRTGEAFRVDDQSGLPCSSADGTLMYAAPGARVIVERQLVWVDRKGQIAATVGQAMPGLSAPRLSPDGRRIAATAVNPVGDSDLWIFDATQGNPVPLIQANESVTNPYWSRDGTLVLYSTSLGGGVVSKPVDGFADQEKIVPGTLRDLSPSGKYAFIRVNRRDISGPQATAETVWAWGELGGKEIKLQPFPASFSPQDVAISPDDKHLAYCSRETGRDEVYLIDFPSFTGRTRVSRDGGDGGSRMVWKADGTELFYVTADRHQLWSVKIKPDSGTQDGDSAKICDLPDSVSNNLATPGGTLFQVAADGQRFLMLQTPRSKIDALAQRLPSVILVENWFEEFRGKK